jgi:hypothetical protein
MCSAIMYRKNSLIFSIVIVLSIVLAGLILVNNILFVYALNQSGLNKNASNLLNITNITNQFNSLQNISGKLTGR